jgi:hypothetical protein
MSGVRIGAGVAAIVVAVLVALLASDLRSWRSALDAGDLAYAQNHATAHWKAATVLPAGLSQGILRVSDDLALRRAASTFAVVRTLGNGVDNGYSESQRRAALEVALTNLADGADRRRDSVVDNMLGILAYQDSQQTGPSAPAPIDRAVNDFEAAVELDPANEDAKFNLEWLRRQLVAHGTRGGGTSGQGGPAKTGHKGAGGGVPGRGY